MKAKFIAPVASLIIGLAILVIALISLPTSTSGIFDESSPYFVKQVEQNHILLVEPNMTAFMSLKQPTPSTEVLYKALDEIKQKYAVDNTKLVRVEFKGVQVPKLYVYVHPTDKTQQARS
ncbi:MAG TPA: hypothetical protein V6C78_21190 [Crinalium sp.]|jgi:flagellar biosynthesis protein FliP